MSAALSFQELEMSLQYRLAHLNPPDGYEPSM
jgi:hypothetical protein